MTGIKRHRCTWGLPLQGTCRQGTQGMQSSRGRVLLNNAPAFAAAQAAHSVTNKLAILSAAAVSEGPRPPTTRQGKHYVFRLHVHHGNAAKTVGLCSRGTRAVIAELAAQSAFQCLQSAFPVPSGICLKAVTGHAGFKEA